MKSWEFYDCIKHKGFGDWIIKTDVYVASLWLLVRFGGDCDSHLIYIGFPGKPGSRIEDQGLSEKKQKQKQKQ